MKVCFARVDRIGDLVLTLPCESVWRTARPQDEIEWLVERNVSFVTDRTSSPLGVTGVARVTGFFRQLLECLKLVKILKKKQFDQVVAFHVPWWVAAGFFLSGIKIRTGVASQWFSWLFYNSRIRQKRSEAVKHESEYNLDLVLFALGGKSFAHILPVKISADENLRKSWSQKMGANYVVIHPGMAGSALNWLPERYFLVAQQLIISGVSVVVTGSESDRDFVVRTKILSLPVVDLVGKTDGPGLLAVLSNAKVVIAPSTGVAHLAASLGKPVIGLYSPVKVQAPLRWKPLGDSVVVLQPKVQCPGQHTCIGPACKEYFCMEQITVDSVLSCVMHRQ